MSSIEPTDLVELFEARPELPTESRRSPGPRHTGICWFNGHGEGYPDAATLTEFENGLQAGAKDVSADLENALADAFFDIIRGGGDHEGGKADIEGEPDILITAYQSWEHKLFAAPDQAMRKYVMEATDKSMLFIGSAGPQGVVELMEAATLLAVAEAYLGVELNALCLGDPACRPWNYELICADTGKALLEGVTVFLREHESTSERWIASVYSMGTAMHLALFVARKGRPALDCIFECEFGTTKGEPAGEVSRAVIFRRDADTAAAIPWNKPPQQLTA